MFCWSFCRSVDPEWKWCNTKYPRNYEKPAVASNCQLKRDGKVDRSTATKVKAQPTITAITYPTSARKAFRPPPPPPTKLSFSPAVLYKFKLEPDDLSKVIKVIFKNMRLRIINQSINQSINPSTK